MDLEGQEQEQDKDNKSRVKKVDSLQSWDFFVNQASNQVCPEVAKRMEIKAMPTFLLMKEGAQVDKLVGANPDELKKRVDGFVQSIRVYVA